MRIGHVLVGTDFSQNAQAAVRWAAQHFVPGLPAGLTLAHAVDVPQPPAFLRRVLPPSEDVAARALEEGRVRLAELAGGLGPLQIDTEARCGPAPQVLADLARERGADMIIVGDHGAGRRGRALLGSTAERLLACSPVPVLIGRDLPMAALAAVLAPLDGSPTDARVLALGRLLHERFGTRVTASHAVDVMELYRRVRTISAATRMREMENEFRTQAQAWVAGRLREAGLPDDDEWVEVRMGDPRLAIPNMAERAQADLIIMGGRGAGAVSRVVLGSVTSNILNTTTYAVLVVVGDDRS
jgi:universal stress protein E